MEVYKNDFWVIYYLQNEGILESVWNIMSVELNPVLIKREMSKRLEMIEKYRPKYLLNNSKEFFYKIPPESQVWISRNIMNQYAEFGVQKSAYIISDDLVAQISIEQTIQEDPGRDYQIQYFDSREEALEWLKK